MKNSILLKSNLVGMLILSLVFLTTTFRCSNDNETPGMGEEFTSLIGKWELLTSANETTNDKGEEQYILVENKKDGQQIIWEFFSNGVLKASENGTNSVNSNWELKVERLAAGNNIDRGTLSLTGEGAELVKAGLKIDELVYNIETSADGLRMYLSIDVSKGVTGIFSRFIITYTYHKI